MDRSDFYYWSNSWRRALYPSKGRFPPVAIGTANFAVLHDLPIASPVQR
jgi:hypothetical protein